MTIRSRVLCTMLCAATALLTLGAEAQPARRLLRLPDAAEASVALPGSTSGHAARATTLGSVPGETQLTSMSLVLKPTGEQDAALTQLLADQQNPASASYHQWLTPEQFGNRFGVADTDIALMQNWLQAHGFLVQSVAESRNRIVFTGTAAVVENAFHVSMGRFRRSDGTEFVENTSAAELPASIAALVSNVSGLSTYRLPTPQTRRYAAPATVASPLYTTATGNHYLVPWDLRQIYGTNTLIGSGYDGTGVKVGIVGQSAVDTTQLTYFQQKTGQTVTLPTMVLVPNTGSSNRVSGDEGESELDLEYASGNAPGASVQFIYTGCTTASSSSVLSASTNCNNGGVFDALTYAVTNNLAPILSLSYGGCEASDAAYATSTLEPVLRQANAQGQTIMVSSGDSGAASCEGSASPKVATGGLAVSYPASSPYVIGVGGTQLNSDSSSYWGANNSYLGSAIGYVPEVAWNDTALYPGGIFTASGGGFSKIFGKPSWQAGPGVPADGHRDVPDVAFPANVTEHAYLTCDADGPCTSGSKSFTLSGTSRDGGGVGGTSAAAPSFAGMLAIVEQANGGKALGNINPSLYALAQGSAASTIFHDITSGNNIVSCTAGSVDCTGSSLGYTAGPGYDQVTGLGSIAIPALRTALQTAASSSNTATVALTASTITPLINTSVSFTASLVGSNGTPTGTVTFAVDGTNVGSAVAVTSGAATYTLSGGFATAGAHTVVARYSGDGTYAAASGTLSTTAIASTGSISLSSSPATLTISAGGSGTEAITITSSGFTGALTFRASLLSSTSSTFPYCLSLSPSAVSLAANATVTATLTVNTAASCATTGSGLLVSSRAAPPAWPGLPRTGLLVASAALLGCFSLRRRLPVSLLSGLLVSLLAVGLVGCGSGGTTAPATTTTTTTTTTTSTNSATTTGTYNLRITAAAATNSSITASTSFTLVVK